MSDIPGSDWFWQLIDQGKQDELTMVDLLGQLNREQLETFYREFVEAVTEISSDMYGDVHGYGDSRLRDLASWVVSQGRHYYASVYLDPSQLPRFDRVDRSKNYLGLPEAVYSRRFGADIPFPE